MTRAQICYILYFVGLAIVALSYTHLIPPAVGWLGWGIGMAGWIAWPRKRSA